jgi:hypothetical protein
VKHLLTSKFFDDPSPGDLEVNGIALIGFGTQRFGAPKTGSVRKLLRVPVRGLLRAAAAAADEEETSSARFLQSPAAAAGTESEFGGLSCRLAPALIEPTVTDDEPDNNNNNNGGDGTTKYTTILVRWESWSVLHCARWLRAFSCAFVAMMTSRRNTIVGP